jgi:hypothetical protein
MTLSFRKAILLGATALTLVAAPMLLDLGGPLDVAAYAKDKGSNGKSNAGGKGKSSNSEKSTGKPDKVASLETAAVNGNSGKVKNLNAQLAGLNSLKRNINGLMNSADPRMEQIRQYVQAGADLVAVAAELEQAETTLGDLQAAFETYLDGSIVTSGLIAYDGATVYADPTLEVLTTRLGYLDTVRATDAAAQAEYDLLFQVLGTINTSAELAAVGAQQGVVNGLAGEVATLEAATSPEAMQAALIAAANENRVEAAGGGAAYLTPEILTWAEAQLGELTDAYIAQQ